MEQSFNWIKAVIATSQNKFHLDCCRVLIRLFTDKYNDYPFFSQSYGELIDDIINRETFIDL